MVENEIFPFHTQTHDTNAEKSISENLSVKKAHK